jgi:hypothetical protein
MPGQHLEANATRCEVMHRVDHVPQIAAKPVHLSNETDRSLEERSPNFLAQGQVLTQTTLCDFLAVKNERLGKVLESLEQTGQLGRTPRGWQESASVLRASAGRIEGTLEDRKLARDSERTNATRYR